MAPLRSLIYEQLEKYKSNRQMHFYFGARNSEELIYSDEFERLSKTFSNFHYHPVLSRADDKWNGYKGYVQEIIKSDLDSIDDIANLEFYLCGPKQMMVDNISLLQSKGIKDDAIAFDDFNPS